MTSQVNSVYKYHVVAQEKQVGNGTPVKPTYRGHWNNVQYFRCRSLELRASFWI